MSSSIDEFRRSLRSFSNRQEIVKQLRRDIRKPVPVIRKKIRKRAVDTLPKSGGLNRWVARTRINVEIKASSRTVSATLKGSKKSAGGATDLRRLDKGRTRHPSWGRRGKGQWHAQTVQAGFFTEPATEDDQWVKVVDSACAAALKNL